MQKLKTLLCLVLLIFIFGSCASIVSKSKWPVSISSNPDGASVVITDKSNNQVFSGTTPVTLDMKSSAGFFQAQKYLIKFSKEGYSDKVVELNATINGWYFGNIIFGGLIGILIVDPASGAMWKLDTDMISETLTKSTALSESTLKVYDVNEIPENWKSHLVLIK